MAVACVVGLALFDRVWIPAQQQYFNERNLRALGTISAQIKAKVDNFDAALDNAVDSFESKNVKDHLKPYVKLFSKELQILTFDRRSSDWQIVTPADPPNVRVVRDEGRSYLYLGYRRESERRERRAPVELIARGDIEQVAEASMTLNDFDALLLLDGQGATIAQRSSPGLALASIEELRDPGQGGTNQSRVFDSIHGTTYFHLVRIGAVDYMLYSQPVQLSLIQQDKRATQTPEEWTLCGLVRLNRFIAASSGISTTYWLWFGAALALVFFAIPLLKLRVISPRERLHRIDGFFVAVATFALMALLAFTAVDLRAFGAIVPGAVDEQLHDVARSIYANVQSETDAIGRQMAAFDTEDLWRKLEYGREPYHSLIEIRKHLRPGKGADINLGKRSHCEPSWSCRSGVLPQLGEIAYPFFRLMVWSDDAGWQRIKWSTSSVVTPFLSLDDAKIDYFRALVLARRLWPGDAGVPTSGVSVIRSPNTNEKLAVFWKALPPLERARTHAASDLTGEVLATPLASLTEPVLPNHVRFAVVDPDGLVLFHSESTRSMNENFFLESEDSPKLRSLAKERGCGSITAPYRGRTERMYVRPLDVTPFGDPKWSLVVFQDAAVTETANIQTINLSLSMFGVYTLALGVIWAVLRVLWPSALTKRLWPDPKKGAQYRRAAMIAAAAGCMCLGARALPGPAAQLSIAAVLIAAAVAGTFLIVRRGAGSSAESATWLADFFRVHASLLFLLAAVPALLCFQVAHDFHTDLVVKRGRSYLTHALDERAKRIDVQARRVPICTKSDSGSQPCPEVGKIVARRTMDTLWDVHVAVTPRQRTAAASDADFGSARLRSFLMVAYHPYNDTAADLLMASPSPGSGEPGRWHLAIGEDGKRTFAAASVATAPLFEPAARPRSLADGVFWLIAVALMGAAYALVRYFLAPLFVLDAVPRAPLPAAAGAADETSLLVIGPPGTHTRERLRKHPRVRVFDVRTLSFTEDPVDMAPSTPVQVSSAADHGPTIEEQTANWPEALQLAISQPVIVALDHLESRLDDRGFSEQMLDVLEPVVYGQRAAIWCTSIRDPIEILDELDPPAPDRHRWARLFEGFRRECLGLEIDRQRADALERSLNHRRNCLAPDVRRLIVAECEVAPELLAIGRNLASRLPRDVPMSRKAVLAEISGAAVHVYRALWDGCAIDEKVALRQLAEEGLVNPSNERALSRMLGAGLVRRNPTFRLMNETFRQFVLGAAPQGVISAWEHEGVLVPWGTIATTGLTVAFGLAGLLLLTQEQLVDAWIRYVPTVAPSIPTVWKLLTNLQKGRLDTTA